MRIGENVAKAFGIGLIVLVVAVCVFGDEWFPPTFTESESTLRICREECCWGDVTDIDDCDVDCWLECAKDPVAAEARMEQKKQDEIERCQRVQERQDLFDETDLEKCEDIWSRTR